MKIDIYTDGACKGNPGKGGYGIYVKHPEGMSARYTQGLPMTTNNRAEMLAALHAMALMIRSKHTEFELFTDSSYVVKGLTEWIEGWKKKDWNKVKNPEIWQVLDFAHTRLRDMGKTLKITWVKGHDTNPGNIEADKLANHAVVGPNQASDVAILSKYTRLVHAELPTGQFS